MLSLDNVLQFVGASKTPRPSPQPGHCPLGSSTESLKHDQSPFAIIRRSWQHEMRCREIRTVGSTEWLEQTTTAFSFSCQIRRPISRRFGLHHRRRDGLGYKRHNRAPGWKTLSENEIKTWRQIQGLSGGTDLETACPMASSHLGRRMQLPLHSRA